ncbi:hypothetical protein GCM10008018_50560 [Paenibacillus marchantiophytorum]|uniref:Secreted protein n=1 Tax=Paenibacillus marchantiophytorum TaxID=1619310 RepID=A0ABQ1F2R4_9BACL|nr:hypothetical protein GCM10008018_50560 [Paenibacillus marchantiophytorum]
MNQRKSPHGLFFHILTISISINLKQSLAFPHDPHRARKVEKQPYRIRKTRQISESAQLTLKYSVKAAGSAGTKPVRLQNNLTV